jgi:hypothetical protein
MRRTTRYRKRRGCLVSRRFYEHPLHTHVMIILSRLCCNRILVSLTMSENMGRAETS